MICFAVVFKNVKVRALFRQKCIVLLIVRYGNNYLLQLRVYLTYQMMPNIFNYKRLIL